MDCLFRYGSVVLYGMYVVRVLGCVGLRGVCVVCDACVVCVVCAFLCVGMFAALLYFFCSVNVWVKKLQECYSMILSMYFVPSTVRLVRPGA